MNDTIHFSHLLSICIVALVLLHGCSNPKPKGSQLATVTSKIRLIDSNPIINRFDQWSIQPNFPTRSKGDSPHYVFRDSLRRLYSFTRIEDDMYRCVRGRKVFDQDPKEMEYLARLQLEGTAVIQAFQDLGVIAKWKNERGYSEFFLMDFDSSYSLVANSRVGFQDRDLTSKPNAKRYLDTPYKYVLIRIEDFQNDELITYLKEKFGACRISDRWYYRRTWQYAFTDRYP